MSLIIIDEHATHKILIFLLVTVDPDQLASSKSDGLGLQGFQKW